MQNLICHALIYVHLDIFTITEVQMLSNSFVHPNANFSLICQLGSNLCINAYPVALPLIFSKTIRIVCCSVNLDIKLLEIYLSASRAVAGLRLFT